MAGYLVGVSVEMKVALMERMRDDLAAVRLVYQTAEMKAVD